MQPASARAAASRWRLLGLISAMESGVAPNVSAFELTRRGEESVATLHSLLDVPQLCGAWVVRARISNLVWCKLDIDFLRPSMRKKRKQGPDRDGWCVRHLAPPRVAQHCLSAIFL